MYYFSVVLFLAIVFLLYLGFRFFGKEWQFSKKTIRIIIIAVAVVAVGIFIARTPLNARLYKKIQSTDEIVVFHTPEEYDNVFFELKTDSELVPQHMGAFPVFMKASDVSYICDLLFGSTSTGHIESIHLYEVTNPGAYPDYAYFSYNGKYYAFLTSKNLYSNASFTFNKEFGEQVLQAIGPYCINK